MLVLYMYRILVAILLLLSVGYAVDTNTADDISDSSLLGMVPDCALDCLNSFIKSEYTPEQCKSPSDIPCICRHKSTSGETLGEAALSCVRSKCTQKVLASSSAGNICISVSGAVSQASKTHTTTIISDSTITMRGDATTTSVVLSDDSAGTTVIYQTQISYLSSTPTPTTSSTTSSASSDLTFYNPASLTSETGRTASTQTAGTKTTSTQTTNVNTETTSTETTSTEQTSVPSSNTSADINKKDHHGISAAAVIGISVASGIAVAFIIGVAVFICCKKRRKQQDESDPHVFEIGGAMAEPPDFLKPMPRLPMSGPDPQFPSSPVSSEGRDAHQMSSVQPMAFIRSQSPYSPGHASPPNPSKTNNLAHQERIGFAVSSDSDWNTSPRTQSSQHSVARLIPEGSMGLYPKPLKWSHRPTSGETLFEEDESQQTALAAGKMKMSSPKPGVPPKLAGLPANPRAYKAGGVGVPAGPRPGPPRALAPPFWHTSTLRTSISESSTAPNDTATTSNHTSNSNTLFTPFTSKSQPQLQNPQRSPLPSSSNLPPGSEIVSKPRIVQGKDIRRVQVRNSPLPPSEVVAPYCPEDLWLERGRTRTPPESGDSFGSGEPPYPSDRFPGDVHYPDSPKKKAVTVDNRVSPTSRNLTPSRRGEDLILRVD